jgi:hypothetical protein
LTALLLVAVARILASDKQEISMRRIGGLAFLDVLMHQPFGLMGPCTIWHAPPRTRLRARDELNCCGAFWPSFGRSW